MRFFCSLLAAGLLAATSVHAAGIALQPHRAIYDLTLKRSESSSGIERLDGRLVVEFQPDCEGYGFSQRIVMRMMDSEGQEAVNDFRAATWENTAGTKFRFNVRTMVDGTVIEENSGRAQLQSPGAAGSVDFSDDKTSGMSLPAGTVFPVAHTMAILKTANAGGSELEIKLFDGSGEDGRFDTFSWIGPRNGDGAHAGDKFEIIAGIASWPVRMAYFPFGDQVGIPDFEIGFRLFANGVYGDIVLDYGDFALDGRLSRVDPLPRPSC